MSLEFPHFLNFFRLIFLIVQPVARQICRIRRQAECKTVYSSKQFDSQVFSDYFFHSYKASFFPKVYTKIALFSITAAKTVTFWAIFARPYLIVKISLTENSRSPASTRIIPAYFLTSFPTVCSPIP